MMKRILKLTILLFAVITITSCAKDIVELTGDIQGVVKDFEGEQLLENCRVALSPGGRSTSTDANGSFSFEKLEAGVYTISISKSGYGDETQEVSVVTGQTTRVNIYMKLPSATTGAISGTIKDYSNGHLISNCNVSLSPGGRSLTSSSSGIYEFSELSPGSYSLSFAKAGYEDANTLVTVNAGKITTADILLKAKSSFAISENSYDFGDLEVSKTFYLFNNSDESTSFSISNIPFWLSISKTSGTVRASGDEAITIMVDRTKVSEGEYSQNITISYSGKSSGSETLSVKMKKVVLTSPTVSISVSADNIKQNSFDISGSISATGGSQITNYGHCWNTSGNPTINDNKTDFGATNAICSFKSTVEDLSTYTTYYVRAYAKNAQGISYSEQITVTTQDVASDKWDGNIASSFAGGSGTYVDPYIIKTGGQLLLAKNYSNKYFELGGNIDLNNNNWLPYSFSGNLDGKGYSISNLYISRGDDCQGLFSICSGFVSNLTIKQVSIKASSNSYVGTISGKGGTISNCKVILDASSSIIGKEYVGGISGANAKVTECFVESKTTELVIRGSRWVGGVLGASGSEGIIERSRVLCNISGSTCVGGIIGINNAKATIQSCSYSGNITGEGSIGGIVGDNHTSYSVVIEGCKVEANVTATNGDAGGIIGTGFSYSDMSQIKGCYSSGNIVATGKAGGLATSSSFAYLSYSVMNSSSSNFYGLGESLKCYDCATTASKATSTSSSNIKADCTDITTFLKESYSEYASYWNYNSSWIWEGSVGGSSARVKCPKLAWE